jgi:hypothetical protein
MKTLIFAPVLIESVRTSRKPGTIRLYRGEAHEFRKGEEIVGDFGPRGHHLLRVTDDTATCEFRQLTPEQLAASGFTDLDEAFDGLSEFYPSLKQDSKMAFIGFQYLGEIEDE